MNAEVAQITVPFEGAEVLMRGIAQSRSTSIVTETATYTLSSFVWQSSCCYCNMCVIMPCTLVSSPVFQTRLLLV